MYIYICIHRYVGFQGLLPEAAIQELLRSVSDMQARQKEHEVLRLNLELRQARASLLLRNLD